MEVNEHAYKNITRRKTTNVTVGHLNIGSDNPVLIQSMTNTKTEDVEATLSQIQRCVEAGADLMRVSVPDEAASIAFKEIVKRSPVPLIADIHFHYKRGIEAADAGAACLRINPGNIGSKERAMEVVRAAKANNCSIRIGVNVGSLEEDILQKYKTPCPEALAESAMKNVRLLEDMNFYNFKISVKASDVILMVKSYEILAHQCSYPLHLGVTEAGPASSGTVKSSIGIGSLLMQGIGDTIRISLSSPPEEEVKVAWNILKSLDLRHRGVNIVSCPSCSRQQFNVIDLVSEIEAKTAHISQNIRISMLGCVVNGLGEARESDIGVTGAVNGNHLLYLNGELFRKSKTEYLVQNILELIDIKIISS